MTVRSLFRRASRWTRFKLTDGHGPTRCYCLIGALEHAYGVDSGEPYWRYIRYMRARARVQIAINRLFPGRVGLHNSIATFNDHAATTIADVRKVCRAARV